MGYLPNNGNLIDITLLIENQFRNHYYNHHYYNHHHYDNYHKCYYDKSFSRWALSVLETIIKTYFLKQKELPIMKCQKFISGLKNNLYPELFKVSISSNRPSKSTKKLIQGGSNLAAANLDAKRDKKLN